MGEKHDPERVADRIEWRYGTVLARIAIMERITRDRGFPVLIRRVQSRG